MASMSDVNRGGSGGGNTTTPAPAAKRGIQEYFKELGYEWKKISFPSRKELQQSTVVVFVFTLLIMAIISFLDVIIGQVFLKFILPPTVGGG